MLILKYKLITAVLLLCSWEKLIEILSIFFLMYLLNALKKRSVFGLGASESPRCCLQTMWFCWHHQTVTPSMHWNGLQLSVKWLGWGSAPPSPRPWFSAGKGWIAPIRLGLNGCLSRGVRVSSGLFYGKEPLPLHVERSKLR